MQPQAIQDPHLRLERVASALGSPGNETDLCEPATPAEAEGHVHQAGPQVAGARTARRREGDKALRKRGSCPSDSEISSHHTA